MQLNEQLLQRIASNVQIFNGMPRQFLINILDGADKWTVAAGQYFFSEGDAGSTFYVLVSGEAVVEKQQQGKTVVLAALKPGDCFGEMALVNSKSRSASVCAKRDAIALRFSRERVDSYPEAAAFIYRNFAKLLARRLQESGAAVAHLTLELNDVQQQAKALAQQASQSGEKQSGSGSFY